jgi:hypothetical protein
LGYGVANGWGIQIITRLTQPTMLDFLFIHTVVYEIVQGIDCCIACKGGNYAITFGVGK